MYDTRELFLEKALKKSKKLEKSRGQNIECSACKNSFYEKDGYAFVCMECFHNFNLIAGLKKELKTLNEERPSEGRDLSYLQGRRHELSEIIERLKTHLF